MTRSVSVKRYLARRSIRMCRKRLPEKCLRCFDTAIFPEQVFTLLQSVNPPCKPLKLPPFAMWPSFPASDYYEGSVNLHSVGGHTPLSSVQAFPSSHAGLNTRARLPIAVFILACRKSSRVVWSSHALSKPPAGSRSCRSCFVDSAPTCGRLIPASCLLSRVGRGDISTLRCVSIGSCSSTVPRSA